MTGAKRKAHGVTFAKPMEKGMDRWEVTVPSLLERPLSDGNREGGERCRRVPMLPRFPRRTTGDRGRTAAGGNLR